MPDITDAISRLPALPVRADGADRVTRDPLPIRKPRSLMVAMGRGAVNRCPRCRAKGFFARFLKPVPICLACGQDWTHQRADDFPAYVVILLTGHLLAPMIIAVEQTMHPQMWVQMTLWPLAAAVLMMTLLQPAKGAIIAVQWWFGMHGFASGQRNDGDP